MKDEFDRIMEFFDLPPEEKEEHLAEVFAETAAYFERFKYTLIHGTPKERDEAIKRVGVLKQKIEEETKRLTEKTGLSEEELAKVSQDPSLYDQDQYEAIEKSKREISEGVQEIKEVLSQQQGEPQPPLAPTPPKKKKKRKGPKPPRDYT